MDTRAARGSVDPDMAANQANLPVPTIRVDLEGVGLGGTRTICGIPRDLAVVAAAAVCPTVDCAPTQLCPSQSQGSLGSQFVNRPKHNPEYFVPCCPNTGSLISNPAPSLAASVQ